MDERLRVEQRGDVALVTLLDGENRIDSAFTERLDRALDAVMERADGPCGLVVAAEGRFWSNGIALEAVQAEGRPAMLDFFAGYCRLLGRILTLPIPTVAALNGHCVAGGALLATAFDYRVMREDRGWLCLPEVDLGTAIHPTLWRLLRSKLPEATARDALLSGRRWSAAEASAAGWVDAVSDATGLLERAVEIAAGLATKDRRTFGAMKAALHGEVGDALAETARRALAERDELPAPPSPKRGSP